MIDEKEDEVTREFIRDTCAALKEDDYQFSVDARGTPWDAYYFTAKGYRGTVAFRIIEGQLEIGVFQRGEMTAEAVVAVLIEGAPN